MNALIALVKRLFGIKPATARRGRSQPVTASDTVDMRIRLGAKVHVLEGQIAQQRTRLEDMRRAVAKHARKRKYTPTQLHGLRLQEQHVDALERQLNQYMSQELALVRMGLMREQRDTTADVNAQLAALAAELQIAELDRIVDRYRQYEEEIADAAEALEPLATLNAPGSYLPLSTNAQFRPTAAESALLREYETDSGEEEGMVSLDSEEEDEPVVVDLRPARSHKATAVAAEEV